MALLLFLFLLLETMRNFLLPLLLRAVTFSDHERWCVRGVPLITSTEGSPVTEWMRHVVDWFVRYGSRFIF